MKAGTILFSGTDLGLFGAVRFTLKRTPEPAAPARPTHRRVEITVGVELRAEMPATVWARVRALHGLLGTVQEGLLEIRDENGTTTSWLAVPGENTLPQVIERHGGRVEMAFTATEPLADSVAPLGMTIDPLDGSPVITIARMGDWSESTRIMRPDSRASTRSEIASSLVFQARTAYADPLAGVAARAEQLLAEAERLRALSGKEARLVFAGFDRIVQLESFSAKPSAGWEWIELDAQARFVTLPGDNDAEVSFTSDSAEDPATGETRTTVSGQVRAGDRSIASAKVDAILAAWHTSGRRVVKVTRKDAWLDGHDTDEEPQWLGLDFSIELSEGSNDTRYTLKIDTREGTDGRHITYSGTACAASMNGLLATVEEAAGNKHPVELREELSVDYATDDDGTPTPWQGSFNHEYVVASVSVRGEVSRVTSRDAFGDSTTTVSGSITAASAAAATTIARSYYGSNTPRTQHETTESSVSARGEQFHTMTFQYSWLIARTGGSVSRYEDSTTIDYARWITERTVSGEVWGSSSEGARSIASGFITGDGITRESYSDQFETQPGGGTRFVSSRFSITQESPLAGSGHDLCEFSHTEATVGSVAYHPVVNVPGVGPVVMESTGNTMGHKVYSGTVKARSMDTAIGAGRARIGTISSGGVQDPPEERITQTTLVINGVEFTAYEFGYQYGYRSVDIALP